MYNVKFSILFNCGKNISNFLENCTGQRSLFFYSACGSYIFTATNIGLNIFHIDEQTNVGPRVTQSRFNSLALELDI